MIREEQSSKESVIVFESRAKMTTFRSAKHEAFVGRPIISRVVCRGAVDHIRKITSVPVMRCAVTRSHRHSRRARQKSCKPVCDGEPQALRKIDRDDVRAKRRPD